MLTNFFKNIFYDKSLRTKQKDPISVGYDRLNNLNTNSKLENLEMFQDDLLASCLDKAIGENNLPLIKNLYPYMKKNIKELKTDKHEAHLFTYATTAMKADKIDVFDYFITTYIKAEFRQKYSPRFSNWEFGNLVELMIKDEKVHYLEVLRHYGMFCCHDYLADYLSGESYRIRDNTNQLKFMLDNFPVEPHHPEWYKFFKPKSIDVNELLIAAGNAEELESNVIEMLLENGADVKYKKSYALSLILSKIDMDVFKVLEKNNIPINIKRIKVDNPIYPFVKKWSETKKLSQELINELTVQEAPVRPRVNKL